MPKRSLFSGAEGVNIVWVQLSSFVTVTRTNNKPCTNPWFDRLTMSGVCGANMICGVEIVDFVRQKLRRLWGKRQG